MGWIPTSAIICGDLFRPNAGGCNVAKSNKGRRVRVVLDPTRDRSPRQAPKWDAINPCHHGRPPRWKLNAAKNKLRISSTRSEIKSSTLHTRHLSRCCNTPTRYIPRVRVRVKHTARSRWTGDRQGAERHSLYLVAVAPIFCCGWYSRCIHVTLCHFFSHASLPPSVHR